MFAVGEEQKCVEGGCVSRRLRSVCLSVSISVRGIQNPWCGSRPAVDLQNLKWSHAMVWMRSSDSDFAVGIAIISVPWR